MDETRQAQLEAVLRGIEERTPHRKLCISVTIGLDDIGARIGRVAEEPLVVCTCDRSARVRAEQARTVERMIKAATVTGIAKASVLALRYRTEGVPQGWDMPILEAAWAAALRAGEPHE